MMSITVSKTILNMVTSLFVIAVTIYSLVSPFMTITNQIAVPAQFPGPGQVLTLITDIYVDKACVGGVCQNVDSSNIGDESLRSAQKTLYALYIILIIYVAAVMLLHVMKVDIKPWWLTSVIMVALCLAILLTLVITVKTQKLNNKDIVFNNNDGEFTIASILMIVSLCMLIFKKLFYMGIMQ
jgi:hypothetical protein